MCIVCVLGFTTILKNPFFFFWKARERERKKIIFQHVHVSTMMYTLLIYVLEDFPTHYSKQFLLL